MTQEEQKRLIEGYINGLMEGADSEFYVSGDMEKRGDEMVISLDIDSNSPLLGKIANLEEKIESMLDGERLPFHAEFRFEIVITEEERGAE